MDALVSNSTIMQMNSYKLDDEIMDEKFINGEAVFCNAVILHSDYQSGKIKEGERIVVMLSNGKKYMGEILSFHYSLKNKFAHGKLEIIRSVSNLKR